MAHTMDPLAVQERYFGFAADDFTAGWRWSLSPTSCLGGSVPSTPSTTTLPRAFFLSGKMSVEKDLCDRLKTLLFRHRRSTLQPSPFYHQPHQIWWTSLALCKLWGLDRRQKRAPAPDLTVEFNHRWIEPLHTPYASSEEKSSVAETMHISIVHVADSAINFRTRYTTALSKTQERSHHAVLSQQA